MGRKDWSKIEAEYLTGGVTLQELAERHGVNKRTMERHASKHQWADRRREVAGQVSAELPALVAEATSRELSDYLSASLDALEQALAQGLAQMQAGGLEFKSMGEAMAAIARVAKAQADLAQQALSGEEAVGSLEEALDEIEARRLIPAPGDD